MNGTTIVMAQQPPRQNDPPNNEQHNVVSENRHHSANRLVLAITMYYLGYVSFAVNQKARQISLRMSTTTQGEPYDNTKRSKCGTPHSLVATPIEQRADHSCAFSATVIPTTTTANTTIDKTTTIPQKLFGHLHYAKTAGTTINGELAAKFERVCGHKGYSYDAYQFNQRVWDQIKKRQNRQASSHDNGTLLEATSSSSIPMTIQAEEVSAKDLVNNKFPGYNRGRVPGRVMKEIGFENCDYVSLEQSWKSWLPFVNGSYPYWDVVELHVPCRDPLDHLLSQCNHQCRQINCESKNLTREIEQCLIEPNRFDLQLEEEQPYNQVLSQHEQSNNTTNTATTAGRLVLKCFEPIPVQRYLTYMEQFLQPKRVPATYIHRETNRAHKTRQECLRKPVYQRIAQKAKQILIQKYPYYQWCQDCLLDPSRNLFFLHSQQALGNVTTTTNTII